MTMKTIYFLAALLISSLSLCAQAASFKTEKWNTSNGARVVFYQANEVPMLDISIAFAAGSAYDNNFFGLAALTNRLLDQGNSNLDANQIAEKIANTGAQFDSEVSRDMAIVRLKTLTSLPALNEALDTFNLIVNKPNFRQDAFNREKNQQIIAITQAQESPADIANNLFFSKLYKNHPYGHPVNGTVESVKKISNWQVKDFYKKYYVANNAVIVMVGAISSQQAHEIADNLVKNIPAGVKSPAIAKSAPLAGAEQINFDFSSSQTVLKLGQIGIQHDNPDYFPLMVGNYILGGGSLVSRLSTEIREKNGLTYGISSQFMPMPGNGPFMISFSTQNNQAKQALKMTQDTLNDFLKSGPTDDELNAAKQYLTGSFPLSLSSNSNIAGMLLRMTFYNLPDNYLDTYVAHIEAVTAEDIKKAFDMTIHPERMLLISVGKM
ncbi:insulinase family protein [Legionella quinlivanii]|nr:pitrilysin family protein [Legionella quinlivanii]MCW8449869.1 insulinase family protein [Legionella quinlivanii]